MPGRPPIPSHIKRKVRQRCGFGCVICGLPIYEYDHLPGYERVKRHRADELTLLCPMHHTEKTKGLLPVERVAAADRSPFNRQQLGTSPHALWFGGTAPEIVLGTQLFTCDDPRRPTVMIPILANRQAPFGFTLDRGGMTLSLDARDSKNRRVLYIHESELVVATVAWDATFVGSTLTIWEKSRDLALQLEIAPPRRVTITRYHVNSNGVEIDVNPTKVEISGPGLPRLAVQGGGTISANIGVLVGDHPKGLSVAIRLGT
jgi:hypothetical protein